MNSGLLTVDEKIELSHLETRIEKGVKASLDMAQALLEVRERKLYRQNYATFESYCYDKWQFSDRYARMLISFAEVVDNLENFGTVVPVSISERQVRPLASLPAEQQPIAWDAAHKLSENPTSETTKKVAQALKTGAPHSIGQTVTVIDEDSPHYRKQVEIVASESGGVLLQCKIDDEPQPQLFLRTSLANDPIRIPDEPQEFPLPIPPASKPQVKQSGAAILQSELEIEQQRVALLEKELERLIRAIKMNTPQERLLELAVKAEKIL